MALNKLDLFRALGDVDDTFVEEAEKVPKKRLRFPWGTAVAACLCVAALFLAFRVFPGQKDGETAGTNLPATVRESGGTTASIAGEEGQISPDSVSPQGAETVRTQGTETPQTVDSYGQCPADFAFTLSWDGRVYDSAAGVDTAANGATTRLALTAEQLQGAWNLLSGLELSGGGSGEITLTVTYDGLTRQESLGSDDYGPVLSICTELARLVWGDSVE